MEEDPQEREVGVDTSTNYALNKYAKVPFCFSLEYNLENLPRRLVSFLIGCAQDSLAIGVTNTSLLEIRTRRASVGSNNELARSNANLLPRNRLERRAEQERQ